MRFFSPDPGDRRLFLIDGSAYIYRAYHAIRDGLAASDGRPTGAVFGFSRMMLQLLETENPSRIAVVFDAKGPTFRHELYGDYKANRPPMPEDLASQVPLIHKVTDAMGLPRLEMSGYEADDIIGALACRAAAAGMEAVMVTGDKDFLQLLADGIRIWDPMKNKKWDAASAEAGHGLPPALLVEAMALAGDTADNVPGVPGIGMKTGVKLISEFGNLEGLYENIDRVSGKKRRENLAAFRDQAFLSRDLVTIRVDIPLDTGPEDLLRQAPDIPRLGALFRDLEFRTLSARFSGDEAPGTASGETAVEREYRAITSLEDLDRFIARMTDAELISVDTETSSEDPMCAELAGISLAIAQDEGVYIPLAHVGPDGSKETAPEQIPMDTALDRLRPVLEDPDRPKTGQNIKYDALVLKRHGIALSGIRFDTMVAAYLLDPVNRGHSLDRIAAEYLGRATITYESVAGKGASAIPFARVPLETAVPYAAEDAEITLAATRELAGRLKAENLTRLMDEVEIPLLPVLTRMEETGIRVDGDFLGTLSGEFGSELETIREEIYRMAGRTFNIQSSRQLGDVLFNDLGLPAVKKTKKKTGFSTDVEVLTQLARTHELPALVLRHRELAKLKSTYADALRDLIHPETGRVHTSFNQTITVTGRLSSSKPNLQNIPVRTEEGRNIRRAFIPREGWRLLAADYSQVELRLLAHYSADKTLIRAFEKEEDIHTRTASEIFGIMPEMISADLRREAKTINFGIIYGMGAFRLSRELGISRKMAQTYIDQYFARYPGVRRFTESCIAAARETGQSKTLLGRVRRLPDIRSRNRNLQANAERTAVNTPVQGTAADFIKLAMIRTDEAVRARGLQAALLLTVHDELVLEAPPEEITLVTALVTEAMERVWPALRVPLKINLQAGFCWAEIH